MKIVDKCIFLGYNEEKSLKGDIMKDFLKVFKDKKNPVISILLCVVVFAGIILGVFFSDAYKKKEASVAKSLQDAELLAKGYFYDEAINVLESNKYAKDERIIEAKTNAENEKGKLVPYEGEFYHVFFHSLIVYPELAFDGDYTHEGYDMWMTTVSEFKAMLPELYARGFVLYPLHEYKKDEPILLPEGKKPLVISIDDVNYYDYMEKDGFADKLVVDDEGNVLCEVKTPRGDLIRSYEGDVMPILDSFVKAHPDFSYKGAKGIVAVTGYEGVFGYNFIKAEGEEKEKLISEAKKVAHALKNTGWKIACHSYTHNDYFKDGKVPMEKLTYDTNRFKERIYSVVLEPDIYISPFGYHLNEGDERLKYLKDMGYNIYCPVSSSGRTFFTEEGVLIQDRFNLDRYNMRTKKEFINETFFDVEKVYYNIS